MNCNGLNCPYECVLSPVVAMRFVHWTNFSPLRSTVLPCVRCRCNSSRAWRWERWGTSAPNWWSSPCSRWLRSRLISSTRQRISIHPRHVDNSLLASLSMTADNFLSRFFRKTRLWMRKVYVEKLFSRSHFIKIKANYVLAGEQRSMTSHELKMWNSNSTHHCFRSLS